MLYYEITVFYSWVLLKIINPTLPEPYIIRGITSQVWGLCSLCRTAGQAQSFFLAFPDRRAVCISEQMAPEWEADITSLSPPLLPVTQVSKRHGQEGDSTPPKSPFHTASGTARLARGSYTIIVIRDISRQILPSCGSFPSLLWGLGGEGWDPTCCLH